MDAASVSGAGMVTPTTDISPSLRSILSEVTDPEIPVLTIEDIGILRDINVAEDGTVTVTITPTYSGCPAMEVIESDITSRLAESGYEASVVTTLDPAWTTEWMTRVGKDKLRAFGIAPPGSVVAVVDEVLCPRCDDPATRVVSEFGSTACKRLMVCTSCGEPFDQFKAI
jgi:ring-1,2-phenylacetyl-CoA epoxidase subunit PaaD